MGAQNEYHWLRNLLSSVFIDRLKMFQVLMIIHLGLVCIETHYFSDTPT